MDPTSEGPWFYSHPGGKRASDEQEESGEMVAEEVAWKVPKNARQLKKQAGVHRKFATEPLL